MNRFIPILTVLVFLCPVLHAQKPDLYIKKGDQTFYLEHKVAPKESFFSVGRLYNVHPRFLASYNKMDINKGLFADAKIRIPLTDTNFTQTGNKGTPVYYKPGDKDDWDGISRDYHVSTDQLISWNGEALKKGQKIIVGLLNSKGMEAITISEHKESAPVTKEEVKEEKSALKNEQDDLKKSEEKDKKKDPVPEIKTEEKNILPAVDKKPVTTVPDNKQGYFRNAFEQQVKKTPLTKNETVTSGIFKTSSGWDDNKYYLLVDGPNPGTIVKVVNPTNNKVIYAKVLGQMSGIRQNDGLNIRICNAAAGALEITETDKFIVKIIY